MTATIPMDGHVRGDLPTPWVPAAPGPWSTPGLDVQGHRGARGEVAESTLAGFLRAVEAGCSSVELDVQLSRDGVPVVWHDSVLLPGRCRADDSMMGRRVGELTIDELALVDVGSVRDPRFPHQETVPGAAIMTLESLARTLHLLHPELWLTVEVKCDPRDPADVAGRRSLVEATIATLREAEVAEHAIIHSFDWSVLALAREIDDSMTRSALAVAGETYQPGSPWTGGIDMARHGADLAAAAAEAGAHMLSPYFSTAPVTDDSVPAGVLPGLARLVERAHGLGLAVVPWTVNHEDDLRDIVVAGVDGLVTDFPERAVAVAANLGALTPEPVLETAEEEAVAPGQPLTIHEVHETTG